MSVSERIAIAPPVLQWARKTSGLDHETAAKRLQVRAEKVQAWEEGAEQPTINQLRKLGKLYKRPLAVLLLPEPPMDFQPLKDFRRMAEQTDRSWSPALHAEIKRAISQREVILELAELSPASIQAPDRRFSLSQSMGADEAGKIIRSLLGMDSWAQAIWSEPRKALTAAIAAVEGLGILVLQTRDVTITEVRGFSISEWPHPVIVLNGADWPRPRLFTLLHELCHVGLNAGGLCDLHEVRTRQRRAEDTLEHFCNEVAASVLLPRQRLLADPMIRRSGPDHRWTLDELAAISQRYGASSEAVMLRLVGLQLTTWDLYWERKSELEREYADALKREKERQKQSTGGPNYFVIKARNLGHGYVVSVLDAFQARAISSLDVSYYLDIKFDQLPKLEKAALR